jgi:anthranilate synthase component 2
VAFGGLVRRSKVGPVHGKSSKVLHTESVLFRTLKDQFEAGRYHSLEIGEPAPGIIVTARTEDGSIMAVEHMQYPIYGLQFHPESVLTPEGLKIIENFLEVSRNYKKRKTAV